MWAKYTSTTGSIQLTQSTSASDAFVGGVPNDLSQPQTRLGGRGTLQLTDNARLHADAIISSFRPLDLPPPIRRPRVVDWLLSSSSKETPGAAVSGAPPSTSSSPAVETATGMDTQREMIAQLLDALEGQDVVRSTPPPQEAAVEMEGPRCEPMPGAQRRAAGSGSGGGGGLSKARFAELGLEPPRNGSTESLDFLGEINDAVAGAQARLTSWEQQQHQQQHGPRGDPCAARSYGSECDDEGNAGLYRKPRALRPRHIGTHGVRPSDAPQQSLDKPHELLLERGMEEFERRRRADAWRREHQGPSGQTRQAFGTQASNTDAHGSGSSARIDADVEDFLRRGFSAFEEKQREIKKKSMLTFVRPKVVDTWDDPIAGSREA